MEQGRKEDRGVHVQRCEEEGLRRGIQVAEHLPQIIMSDHSHLFFNDSKRYWFDLLIEGMEL